MEKGLKLKISRDNTSIGYLYLPNHPDIGKTSVSVSSIRLANLIEEYKGPEIILDFNTENVLIGIEIID